MSITTIYDYDKGEAKVIEEKNGQREEKPTKKIKHTDNLPEIVKAKLKEKNVDNKIS